MNKSTMRTKIFRAIDADIQRQRKAGSRKNSFGHYWEIINGVLVSVGGMVDITGNAQPTQGLNNMLMTTYGPTAKPGGWFVSLYANAVNPAANWTAASYAGTAGEINSLSEGFSQTTRPQFVVNTAANGIIDSVGHEAEFDIVTASQLNAEGIAILSDSTLGGGAGVLGSAARFGSTRVLNNGDDYRAGFRITLTG